MSLQPVIFKKKIVILNDNAYWMIKWKQEDLWFKDWWLDLKNPDFVKYAESYWAKWYRVSKAWELESLVKKCIDSKWVHLIEVPVDYSENKKLLEKLECVRG